MKAPRCPGCGRFMQLVSDLGDTREYECCVGSRSRPAKEERFVPEADAALARRGGEQG
jgi:hypothetical protein